MPENLLMNLAGVVVLGVGAQWVAWRLGLPSILLLLVGGFVAGPVLALVDPDALLGDLLMPSVSLSVGLILFEGGLTLKYGELKAVGGVVRNLVTVGALVSWAVATVAAHFLFGWDWALATLLGSVLVVTGPTVVIPLIRHIQPSRPIASVLKWEGILIDPIGALLALLVFEGIVATGTTSLPMQAAASFGFTLAIGTALGVGAALLVVVAFRRFWVPDHLQNPVTLALVVGVFTLANSVQHESGLLAVTVMGIALANQKRLNIRHILEFKENLRVLLISCLFILLAARIRLEEIRGINLAAGAVFLAVLLFIARPAAVAVSTIGSDLPRGARVFLAWMAPRGIVAAAVASVFALRLSEAGIARAMELVPVTFLVIVGTVAVYGFTAAPVARALGLSSPQPQGVLFVGANPLARALARAFQGEGLAVLLADTNWQNISAARLEALPTYYGNVLSETARDELELAGIGRVVGLTPNHEVNTLAAMHFIEFFGRSEVYQVQVNPDLTERSKSEPHGRLLFGKDVLLSELLTRLAGGAAIRRTTLSKEFDHTAWREHHGARAIPLFLVTSRGQVRLFTSGQPPAPVAGDSIVSLTPAPAVSPA